jgi:hypothetical protein
MRRAVRIIAVILFALAFGTLAVNASLPEVTTGNWSAVSSSMSQARTDAAVSALYEEGRLLISGGTAADGTTVLASAEIFNSDGSFSAAAPMHVPRTGHTATWLLDGYVLVTGGTTTGGGVVNSAELYDPLTDTWILLPATMADARTGHTATQLPDGNVLIAGGANSAGPLNSVEVFSLAYETFSYAGAMSSARIGHAATALNDGRVLIVGGTDANGNTLASTVIYDSNTGALTDGPSLRTPRRAASATTLLDGTVLIAGGSYPEGAAANAPVELATAEIYDPLAGTITPTPASLASARAGHKAFLLPNNNNVLIVGGSYAGNALSSVEMYGPWTGEFTQAAAMSTARVGAVGAPLSPTVDGKLFVTGGSNQTGAELYGFAWVKTDKNDYAPGEIVTITGGGWQPGETVEIHLREVPLVDTPQDLTAVADAFGNIINNAFAPDLLDLNIRFYLTAVGATSQAQATFTDSLHLSAATITVKTSGCSTNSTNFAIGDTVCASVAATAGGSGSADTYYIQWYKPDGTQARQVSKSVTASSQTDTDSLSLTSTNAITGTWTIKTCKLSGTTCAGTDTWNSKTFAVTKANQTITFGALGNKSYGDPTFAVSATASSGLTVSFSSQTVGVCTANGATVQIVAPGICTIRASQVGNTNYNAAPNVDQSFTVNPAGTTTLASAASRTYSPAIQNVTLSATVTSAAGTVNEGELTFTIKNGATVIGTPTSAPVSGGNASVSYSLPGGTTAMGYTISAVYGPAVTDPNFTTSSDNTHALTVNRAVSVITWANPADIYQGASLGSSQLNATANVPGTFVYTPAAGTTLGFGTSQTLNTTFTPDDATNYAGTTASANINVFIDPAQVSINKTSLTFSATTLSTGSTSQMVTLFNNSGAAITVTPSITGEFIISGNSCTGAIAPGGTQCNLWVRFTPITGGTHTGTFTVNYSGAIAPMTVALNGSGSAEIIVDTTPLSFTANIDDGSTSQTVSILNRTGLPISITPSITGDFIVSGNNCPASLPANNGCYVWVRYTPKSLGPSTGVLTITSGSISHDVNLSGNGTPGPITIDVTPLVFTGTTAGLGSTSQMVNILNRSGAPITVTAGITGDFILSGNGCTGQLAYRAQCNVWVRFTPKSAGPLNGTLTINAGGAIETITLSGTGL